MHKAQRTSRSLFAAMAASVLLFMASSLAHAEGMLRAADGEVADAKGPLALRCVNLSPWLIPEPNQIGGALRAFLLSPTEMKQKLASFIGAEEAEAFWQKWREVFITEGDFERLAKQGFNCVRLPVNYRDLVGPTVNDAVTLDEKGLAPIDRAVEWGAKTGIYVILDLHGAPGGANRLATVADIPSRDTKARLWEGPTAAENQQLTIALWKALAARYANASSVGGYDLLNEPSLPSGVEKNQLPDLYTKIIASIRGVDAQHMIIVEGGNFAHDFSGLGSLPDANLMYEFHEYALLNKEWKNPSQAGLEPFVQLRAATHRPIWLGEFGENSFEWQRQMVELMKANRIGWAVWPWKRIDRQVGTPVIETIAMPESWNQLSRYLNGAIFARTPTPAVARQALSDMLRAIVTENCQEDVALANMLAGR